MNRILALATGGLLLISMTGCSYIGGGTDLSDVATASGLEDVTTGDGTYENYTATGHYTGTEVGVGLGIFTIKLVELIPSGISNEMLLEEVANAAADDGADAMINVTPHKEWFLSLILPVVGGIGIYVDSAEGTGIALD